MSYYETLTEDLQRAKELLALGVDHFHAGDQPVKVVNNAVYGADTYDAYKLIESFVTQIEKDEALIIRGTEALELASEQMEESEARAQKAEQRAAEYRKVMLEIADCIDTAPLPDNREPENIFERATRLRAEVQELQRQKTEMPWIRIMALEAELKEAQASEEVAGKGWREAIELNKRLMREIQELEAVVRFLRADVEGRAAEMERLRDALDQLTAAAGKRMMEKHGKALERLAKPEDQ